MKTKKTPKKEEVQDVDVKASKVEPLDDTREKLSDFLDKIHHAKIMGDEYIETTDEIIAHYNRRGLNGGKYFIFEGIKVFPKGKAEAILEEEDIPLDVRKHGIAEAGVSAYTVDTKAQPQAK